MVGDAAKVAVVAHVSKYDVSSGQLAR